MRVKLNKADKKAANARVRWWSIVRYRGRCQKCDHKWRRLISWRLRVCFFCFYEAKLKIAKVI